MFRIAITGPESTGKSTLAEALAAHYGTVWVPEFARTYIGSLHRPYTLRDIEKIARGQLQAEQEMLPKAKGLLFCDTDLFVIKVWAEHAFGQCPAWILQEMARHPYHLHLLADVDLPWQPDPQREHPHLRAYFLNLYRQELTKAGANWQLVSGSENARLQKAIKLVDEQFPQIQKRLP